MKFFRMQMQYLQAIFCFFFLGVISISAQSQEKNVIKKLSPSLEGKFENPYYPGNDFVIMIRGNRLPGSMRQYNAIKIANYDSSFFYNIHISRSGLMDSILPLPEVLFVEDANRKGREEVLISSIDLGTNKINMVHSKFPQWNGAGATVSIKEDKPDTNDIDFTGRYISTSLASAVTSTHATNMATMIAGAGNSWYTGKGAAWGAKISFSNFANLLPDPLPVLQQYNVSVQNHSYGVGIENFYGADASVYDANMNTNPVLMNVFSSGNIGSQASTTGRYAGIQGFANLTGSFKMAKNIITVGATDSFSNVAALSSKGPAFDGRVKPELVAFGIDGSSGASALVSGVSLILQQEYKALVGSLPASALVKAVLLNSADDRGNSEVDYSNGYGSLNAINAVRTIQQARYFKGSVSNGGMQNFNLSIPAGIKKVKISLVWNDVAAPVNAAKALVNDLDMELQYGSQSWKPWVLNAFPHKDSLTQPATRRRDSLNNVEQVSLDNPAAGNYTLAVRGYSIPAGSQDFYVAYQYDSADVFEWQYPMANDPVFTASTNTIRWKSSLAQATGRLEYSIDNGSTWQLVNAAVNLASSHYDWNSPAVIKSSLLKMTIGSTLALSDTFVIAARTETGVGFNCPDSFLFYWYKLPSVINYRLYKLGSLYLEPLFLTADSFVVLQKNANPSLYYAVAPIVDSKEGLKSYSLNYTQQGVDCYFRSFIVSAIGNSASLVVSLGSLYNIDKIVVEKFDGVSFKPIQMLVNNFGLLVNFTDNNLIKGLNIYRIRLELKGGGIVYSSNENIFYFGTSRYVIYPNPASQYNSVNIAQLDVNTAMMQVYAATGERVYEALLDDRINTIQAGKLSKGIYFIRITDNGKRLETLKLIIQ
ncbi:MAG: S8 family peptidase [Ferruginibacter sp.]